MENVGVSGEFGGGSRGSFCTPSKFRGRMLKVGVGMTPTAICRISKAVDYYSFLDMMPMASAGKRRKGRCTAVILNMGLDTGCLLVRGNVIPVQRSTHSTKSQVTATSNESRALDWLM